MSFYSLFGLNGNSEDANLEGYWPFQDDAASTTVDDASSNNNDGTLQGGDNTSDISTTGPNSWLPKAFALDGTNDYVDLINVLNGAGSFTVGLYFRVSTYTSFAGLICSRDGSNNGIVAVLDSTNSRIRSDVSGVASQVRSSVNSVNTGSWQFFGLRYTGLAAQNWLDGAQDGNVAGTGTATIGDVFRVGWDDFTTARRLNGDTAFPFIFSRNLSDAEFGEIESGPEPAYSSGASLGSDGAFSVGSWGLASPFAAGSNGTITYEVVAANAAGETVDSSTSSSGTLDLSSEAGNTVYLLVRATNTGGYDIGDKSTRTSGFSSSGDGYYELASVQAASPGDITWEPERLGTAFDQQVRRETVFTPPQYGTVWSN